MKVFFSKLFHSKYSHPLLFLALLALVLLSSLPGLISQAETPWTAPTVSRPAILPSATPGWWRDLPTPYPLDTSGADEGEQP